MKKLIGIILLVASIMLALLTGIGTFIIGFKILKTLWVETTLDPVLCLWLLGFVLALGTFMALSTLAGNMCDVDVKVTSDTIVGKHDEDEDGCIVDYDSATLYPSSKMIGSLDSIAPQTNNHKSKKMKG